MVWESEYKMHNYASAFNTVIVLQLVDISSILTLAREMHVTFDVELL